MNWPGTLVAESWVRLLDEGVRGGIAAGWLEAWKLPRAAKSKGQRIGRQKEHLKCEI